MIYRFDAADAIEKCIRWIQDFFEKNGRGCNAVIGISGGKDSSVVAALLVRALGAERVIGVLMPNGEQSDIDVSHEVCGLLGIKKIIVNIKAAVDGIKEAISTTQALSTQATINLPPRVRMSALYAVSQSNNGRVANTCNLSEDWVGYATRYGDGAGDFSPISKLTVTEILAIGHHLGLPAHIVDKVPSDGLCGRTDEENLGFSYAMLDRYIRQAILPPPAIKEKIDRLHAANQFKLELMPAFDYNGD